MIGELPLFHTSYFLLQSISKVLLEYSEKMKQEFLSYCLRDERREVREFFSNLVITRSLDDHEERFLLGDVEKSTLLPQNALQGRKD